MPAKVKKFSKKYSKWMFFYFVLFAFIFGGTYFFLLMSPGKPKPIVYTPQPAQGINDAKEGKFVNFLLLGHGGENHSGGNLMDSIILVSLDTKNKKALEVSIPRDLWVEGHKINEGVVKGGYDLIKHQVQVVTGIFPENYISIDFDNFKKMIDLLGGIDANVIKPYEDKFYPIKGKEIDLCGKAPDEVVRLHSLYSGYQLETQFTCRYENIKFNTGINHMDGETALKYVRSRHGDGDFGRSERQFVVLVAIKEKVLTLGVLKNTRALIDTLFKTVQSNMGLGEVRALAEFFANESEYSVTSIHLTDENVLVSSKSASGQFILLPKAGLERWQEVKNFIKNSTN